MNKYPVWWDSTITVFNKYVDPATRLITWYKTVLTNCFWKYTGNKVTVGETTIESDSTICRVPINKNFREKHLWDNLQTIQRQSTFTFGVGDIIVRGNVDDTVDEYTSGKRSSDLLTKYKQMQGCMVIEKCSISVGQGRGNEHYYVKGV